MFEFLRRKGAAHGGDNRKGGDHSSSLSIVATNSTVQGSLVMPGEVFIAGTVEGDVRAERITVETSGVIQGSIIADTLVVRGNVQGIIRAHRVQILGGARVSGDVYHFELSLHWGAMLDVRCFHLADKTSNAPEAPPQSMALLPSLELARA